jgi:5-(carboxyamino)imidazole ribonucleotide synthase
MTIGIIGGGQLGWMLALAGYPLGLDFRFLDPSPESPAGRVAPLQVGAYDDPAELEVLTRHSAVVTYEFENVPAEAARTLAARLPVYPPVRALEVAQDRLAEKTVFHQLGIPTPPFAPVDSLSDLVAGVDRIGLPAVLKTRRLGYDGKGQRVMRTPADVEPAWAALGATPLILEGFVPFERELSVLAVRGRTGETRCYPLVENHHRDGILHLSLAPAPRLTRELQSEAETYAARLLDTLDYVGVLAVELFQHEGRLLANEMAPRVHNSGHWTIEGAETSQFENHLRAVAGLPLGSIAPVGHSAMVNLIGTQPEPAAVLAVEGAHLHHYGKSPRPGRKLGHVTVMGESAKQRDQRLDTLTVVLGGSPVSS